MKIKTKLHFWLPGEQARRQKTEELELVETTHEAVTPAFVVKDTTYYLFRDKLWIENPLDISFIRALGKKGFGTGRCSEDAARQLAERCYSSYLIIDGKLFRETGEPYYDLGMNPTYGALRIATLHVNSSVWPQAYLRNGVYSALDADLAIRDALMYAKFFGIDTNAAYTFTDMHRITVLHEPAVKVPRAHNILEEYLKDTPPIAVKVVIEDGQVTAVLKDTTRPVEVEIIDVNPNYGTQENEYAASLLNSRDMHHCDFAVARFNEEEV